MTAVLRLAPGVAAVDEDGTVWVARVPEGPVLVLAHNAALIWRAALEGDRTGIVDRVALLAAVDPDLVRADVEGFVAELESDGLLVEEPG